MSSWSFTCGGYWPPCACRASGRSEEHTSELQSPYDLPARHSFPTRRSSDLADDGHVRRRRVDPIDVVVADAERGVLVELEEALHGQPGHVEDQVAVHVELVLHVRRVLAALCLQGLGEIGRAHV